MERSNGDPRLLMIAALTRAYPLMRHTIVAGAAIPALAMLMRAHRYGSMAGILVWLLVLGISIAASEYLVGRFLTRRFGSVVEAPVASAWRSWVPGIVAGVFGFFDRMDAWMIRSGGPSILLTFLAAAALWVTIRDWPTRKHMAVVVLVCALAAGTVPHLAVGDQFTYWRTNAETIALAAWMCGAACDFMVLCRWFPRRADSLRAEASSGRHADTL